MGKISTMYGEFEYSNDDIIKFNRGIPGLEEYTEYLLLKLEIDGFDLLQCVNNKEVGFVVTSPFDVVKDYEVKLTDEILKNLRIKEATDVKLLSLVTLNSDPEKITTNLKAPIVINVKENLGEQLLIDSAKYQLRHPLMRGE